MIPYNWQSRGERGITAWARPLYTAQLAYSSLEKLRDVIEKHGLGEGNMLELNERDFDLIAEGYLRWSGRGATDPMIVDDVVIKISERYRLPQHTVAIEVVDEEQDGPSRTFLIKDLPSAKDLPYRPGPFRRL